MLIDAQEIEETAAQLPEETEDSKTVLALLLLIAESLGDINERLIELRDLQEDLRR